MEDQKPCSTAHHVQDSTTVHLWLLDISDAPFINVLAYLFPHLSYNIITPENVDSDIQVLRNADMSGATLTMYTFQHVCKVKVGDLYRGSLRSRSL